MSAHDPAEPAHGSRVPVPAGWFRVATADNMGPSLWTWVNAHQVGAVYAAPEDHCHMVVGGETLLVNADVLTVLGRITRALEHKARR